MAPARDFVTHGQRSQLEAALEAQRAFWKFIGATLVRIALTILAFMGGVLAGILAVR